MAKIFDEALQSGSVSIRETAMQCLVEIGRQEYNMLPMVDWIFKATCAYPQGHAKIAGNNINLLLS